MWQGCWSVWHHIWDDESCWWKRSLPNKATGRSFFNRVEIPADWEKSFILNLYQGRDKALYSHHSQTGKICLHRPWESLRSCDKEGRLVGLEKPWCRWMGCACHPGYVLQWSRVLANGQYSEGFDVQSCNVQSCFVLSSLLFILVLEALSREFHNGVLWERLRADDQLLIADTQEECIPKPKAWKAGMESKGLHVNMKKTTFPVCSVGVHKKSVKHRYRVGNNSC